MFFYFQGLLNDVKNAFFFTGIIKISTSTKHKQQSTKNNHYDTPKFHYNDGSLILKPNCLVTNGSVKNIIVNEQNNNVIITDDKVGVRSVCVGFFLFSPFYAYKKNKMKSTFVINCFCLLATRQSY